MKIKKNLFWTALLIGYAYWAVEVLRHYQPVIPEARFAPRCSQVEHGSTPTGLPSLAQRHRAQSNHTGMLLL
jgi:hypothetical protein